MAKGGTRSEPGTLGELVEYLAPGMLRRGHYPAWPPDAFGITASVLRITGAYVNVIRGHPTRDEPFLGRDWPARTSRIAVDWRERLDRHIARHQEQGGPMSAELSFQKGPIPKQVRDWWNLCRDGQNANIHRIDGSGNEELCEALLALCLVADDASYGLGIQWQEMTPFLEYTENVVLRKSHKASLGIELSPRKIRVLPKQHTPQRGLSLRSLSRHLALCPQTEVRGLWHSPVSLSIDREPDVLNLLLLPWPATIQAASFSIDVSETTAGGSPDLYRYFTFAGALPKSDELKVRIERTIEKAENEAGKIDALVFPELALSTAAYFMVEEIARNRGMLLIAGVAEPADVRPQPVNACLVQALTYATRDVQRRSELNRARLLQHKHHRWCLDRDQIIQYRLGGRLPASKACWEHIYVGRRQVDFVTLGGWLTLTVLICEDLAQQDPVADLLRAVGPNLVVALLMDGPQLRSRWASRYASVLAGDPGSSVLTLTSLGMSTRSRPRPGEPDRSRVIGLWRDAIHGEEELELPAGHDACVLSLVCHSGDEYTADGRGGDRKSHSPVFGGAHFISTA